MASYLAPVTRPDISDTPPDDDEVAKSWLRSATEFRLDPAERRAPSILTLPELTMRREPLAEMLRVAQDEITRLFRLVRGAGYVVMLCDHAGVAIDHRGEENKADEFRRWGIWLGGVWTESLEGTNGIGTCISDRRPVTIHRAQHFRARHKDLSCSGAPIFDIDGSLLGVLDVSAFDADMSEHAHALTGALTAASARAIDERLFRARFQSDWVIAAALPENPDKTFLLAVDADHRILGADRAARRALVIGERDLEEGIGLWNIFERQNAARRWRDSDDMPIALSLVGADAKLPALVTPPIGPRQSPEALSLHSRPREDLAAKTQHIWNPQPQQGGLSPRTLRKVGDYVDLNLTATIDLDAMAGAAGLSRYYFARQFKQTTGVTPHQFLLSRRVDRAREMLANTDLPLSVVAQASGFADQSHLTRQFRSVMGITPGQFRKVPRRTQAATP